MKPQDVALGRIAVENGVLRKEDVEALFLEADLHGVPLAQILLRRRIISAETLVAWSSRLAGANEPPSSEALAYATPPPGSGHSPAPLNASTVAFLQDRGQTLRDVTLENDIRSRLSTSDKERFTERGELGRGGMGRVAEWLDNDLRRAVAAKLILPEKAQGTTLARFVAEAQITAQLEHPNIVPVHDFGLREDGSLFYTMKRISGRDLQSIVALVAAREAGALEAFPLSTRISIFRSACQALAYAHSRGVVHRDLKPQNIMVGEFGEVLVVDWGLAKVLGEERDIDDIRRSLRVESKQGALLGTPIFMAPEQFLSEPATPASDVWALGAILYAVLTGTLPFDAGSFEDLVNAVLTAAPEPPSVRAPDLAIPPALHAICLKCLHKRPAQRYPDAAALLEDIERYQAGLAVTARPESLASRSLRWVRHNRAKTAALAAAVLALCSGILGMYAWDRHQREQRAGGFLDRAERLQREAHEVDSSDAELHLLIEALTRLDEAQAVRGTDRDLEARRAKLAAQAGDLALSGQEYALASYLFQKAGHLGLGSSWAESKEAEVRGRERQQENADRARIDELVRGVRAGAALEEAVYEVVSMRGPHATVKLLEILRDLPPADGRARRFIIRALGRLRHKAAVEPLVAYLRGEEEEVMRIEAIQALGRLGDPLAEPLIRQIREAAGTRSYLWDQTRDAYARLVPEGVRAEPALPVGASPEEHFERGKALQAIGNQREAIEAYTAALSARPVFPRAHNNRGTAWQALGDMDRAEEDYSRAIEQDAGLAAAYTNRGMIHHQRGRAQAALDDYRKAMDLEPENPTPLRQRGDLLLSMGRSREAEADYTRAVELDPKLAGAYGQRALARHLQGRSDLALADLDKAIDLDATNAGFYSNRGTIHLARGDLDRAVADFTSAIDLDHPLVYMAHLNRGIAYETLGRLDRAEIDYTRAIELGPSDARPWRHRGALRLRLGDPNGARDLEESLRLDPGQDGAEALREAIREAGSR